MGSDAGYTSPSQLAAEQRIAFRCLPIIVGRDADVAEPGRYITHDASGVALLVTRDGSGAVRAMLNVCRHRASRLVFEEEGKAEAFVCRYHAWTYDLRGQLARPGRAILPPALEQFVDDCALVRLPSATRHGFLWVLPTPRAALDVASFLGDADRALAACSLADHVLVRRTTTTRAANWKLVIDALLNAREGEGHRFFILPSSVILFERETVSHVALFPRDVGEVTIIHSVLAPGPGAPIGTDPTEAAIALAERAQLALVRGEGPLRELPAAASFHDALARALAASRPK